MSLTKWLMGATGALASAAAWAEAMPEALASKWNLPVGVTPISQQVYSLHMMIFWICVVIGVIVFGVMFYSVWAHRRSRRPEPADFHESVQVEVAWTVVPFLILIAMAIPATGTLIMMEDTRDSDLSIKVTGYQWMWEYEYLDQDVRFFSRLHPDSDRARQLGSGIDPRTVDNYLLEVDNRMVIPVGKKVRLLITANDVIHSWWIPAFGMKKDAIPGYINEIWIRAEKEGVYRGQCAELCGRDHGFMPVVVEVVSQEGFAAWIRERGGRTTLAQAPAATTSDAAPAAAPVSAPAAAGTSSDELMQKGERAYATHCAACHQGSGKGLPPTFPSLVGSEVVLGDTGPQIRQVLRGNNAMPAFAHLTDADIAAAITYTRNAWGNEASPVQPAQVAEVRGQ